MGAEISSAHRIKLVEVLLDKGCAELARIRLVRGASQRTARRAARAAAVVALALGVLGAGPLVEPAAATTPVFTTDYPNPFGLANVGDHPPHPFVDDISAAPAFADIDGDGDLDAFVGNDHGNTIFFQNTGSTAAPAFAAPSTNPFGLVNVGHFAAPAFADIDGDGDLDAFIGTFSGDTIFFQNTGSTAAPAFAAPSTNPFGLANVGRNANPGLAAPAFADIDGDGDLDAFIGNNYGKTIFFQNTGSTAAPAFATPSTNPFGLVNVGHFAAPAFADIDGDGDLDAFIAGQPGNVNHVSNTLFFQNTGSSAAPAFAAPSTNPFGLANVGDRAAPAFADIDGDGDLDAFIGNIDGNTIFFQNTGSSAAPAFASPFNPFGLADVGGNAAPAFADIDGDGDLDAFVGNSYGDNFFFQNTGSTAAPAFAAPSTNPFGLANVGRSANPAFADIDGDGDLDAFIGSFYGDTSFFQNTGSTAAPAFAAPSTNPFGLAAVGLYPALAFADIDGEGHLDAFIGYDLGDTIFFKNKGSTAAPAFAAPSTNPFGLAAVGLDATPAFADIDGDGDLDAFIGNGSNSLPEGGDTLFFQNTGSTAAPAFASPLASFGLSNTDGLAAPAFADIDGDGDLDAFIGNVSGNTIFFENNGSTAAPAFAAPSTNPFGLASVGTDAAPAFADIDGDGDLDAFIGYGYGDTIFFQNTGSTAAPAFAAPSTNSFGLTNVGGYAAPAFADIDGDGDLDAFIGNELIGSEGGHTIFFRNTGSSAAPTFAAPSASPFGLAQVHGQAAPTFADIDGDADLDAFIGDGYGNTIFFRNSGVSPTSTPTTTPSPTATKTYTATNTPGLTPTQSPTASATALKTSTPTPRRTQTGTPIFTPSKSTCNVVAPERARNGWFLLLPGAALLVMRRRSRRS